MQEHIRRAHPEYYIPKLPATKESFELMITSPPHERPPQDTHGNAVQLPPQQQPQHHSQHSDPSGLSPVFHLDPSQHGGGAGLSSFEGYHLGTHDGGYYTAGDAEAAAIYSSMQAQQRSSDEYRRGSLIPAASAAAALAQLHYHRPDSGDWGGGDHVNMGQVITFPSMQISPTITEADFLQTFYADQHHDMKNHFHVDPALEDASFMPDSGVAMADHTSFPVSTGQDNGGLLPSSLAQHSPPLNRTPTMPQMQRRPSTHHGSSGRPRKSSLLGQQARLGKHERRKSKDLAKRSSGDRKAFSAEPSAAALYGKRWEDLIDAATSATEEEGSRDLTPVYSSLFQSDVRNGRQG